MPVARTAKRVFCGRSLEGVSITFPKESTFKVSQDMQNTLDTVFIDCCIDAYPWDVTHGVIPYTIVQDPITKNKMPRVMKFGSGTIQYRFDSGTSEMQFRFVPNGGGASVSTVTKNGEAQKGVYFYVIRNASPSACGNLHSDLSCLVPLYIQIKTFEKISKLFSIYPLKNPMTYEYEIPASEVILKHFDRIVSETRSSFRSMREMHKSETINRSDGTSLSSKDVPQGYRGTNANREDSPFNADNEVDMVVKMVKHLMTGFPEESVSSMKEKLKKNGDDLVSMLGINRVIDSGTGLVSEVHIPPFVKSKPINIQQPDIDVKELWKMFDQELSSVLDMTNVASGHSSSYKNQMEMYGAQTYSTLGMSARKKEYEKFIKQIYWQCYSTFHENLRKEFVLGYMTHIALIRKYRERTKRTKKVLSQSREKLTEHLRDDVRDLTTITESEISGDTPSTGDIWTEESSVYKKVKNIVRSIETLVGREYAKEYSRTSKDEKELINKKIKHILKDYTHCKKISESADRILDIEFKLKTRQFLMVPDFQTLKEMWENEMISSTSYANLLSESVGYEIEAKTPLEVMETKLKREIHLKKKYGDDYPGPATKERTEDEEQSKETKKRKRAYVDAEDKIAGIERELKNKRKKK